MDSSHALSSEGEDDDIRCESLLIIKREDQIIASLMKDGLRDNFNYERS